MFLVIAKELSLSKFHLTPCKNTVLFRTIFISLLSPSQHKKQKVVGNYQPPTPHPPLLPPWTHLWRSATFQFGWGARWEQRVIMLLLVSWDLSNNWLRDKLIEIVCARFLLIQWCVFCLVVGKNKKCEKIVIRVVVCELCVGLMRGKLLEIPSLDLCK